MLMMSTVGISCCSAPTSIRRPHGVRLAPGVIVLMRAGGDAVPDVRVRVGNQNWGFQHEILQTSAVGHGGGHSDSRGRAGRRSSDQGQAGRICESLLVV